MRHRISIISTWLSLMLCCVLLCFWLRSYWRLDACTLLVSREDTADTSQLGSPDYASMFVVRSQKGALTLNLRMLHELDPQTGEAERARRWSIKATSTHSDNTTRLDCDYYPFGPVSELRVLGFAWQSYSRDLEPVATLSHLRTASGLNVVLPFWLLTAVFAMWPVRQLTWHLRRYRRGRLGLCLVCGYDLRASDKRCPECGQLIVRRVSGGVPGDSADRIGDPDQDQHPR
jgi:hypothetical protein